MKLKKLLTASAMALFMSTAVSAQTTVNDIRIYINPGHGSWGPNNRHMATIGHSPISTTDPDTTDFYESNTNLYKGLALLERLIDYGVPFNRELNQTNSNPNRVGAALDLTQNLVMSRVKSGPFPYTEVNGVDPDQDNDFNRTLSEIANEVENNHFDMFISIHSNAANADANTVNYLAYYYRTNYGADGTKSIAMCNTSWNQRILDRHTQWTHYDNQVNEGSVSIQTGNYWVLGHSVPGYLVEGYFHTYQPARHRGMNFDVDRLEGVSYARGVADYFGWEKENVGEIYGIVRDTHEKFSHELYIPRAKTDDIYKPINGITAYLIDKDGNKVDSYTTDVNYNGAFIFRKVTPGEYTIEFSTETYKPLEEPLKVIVEAAKTSYPTAFLEANDYVPPTITYYNYPDSLAGKDYALADEYNVKGEELNTLAEQLTGKTVRRQLIRDNKMYVLALDANNEPSIYVVNLADNTVAELGTTGTQTNPKGLKLSDIVFTADGYLLGCNSTMCQDSDSYVDEGYERGTYRIYKWEMDENNQPAGDPVELHATQYAAMYLRAMIGETIAFSGTLEEGTLITTAFHGTGGNNGHFRYATFDIINGSISDGNMNNYSADSPWNTASLGTKLSLKVSPLDNNQFVLDGDLTSPIEFATDGTQTKDCTILGKLEAGKPANASINGDFFKYAGKSVMLVPDINEENKVAGIKAYDITNGLDKATEIIINGTAIEPAEYTYASVHGEVALELEKVDRDNYKTTDAEIELFLAVDGKVYKFTTKDVEQPAKPSEFAYNLTMNESEGKAVLNFDLTGTTTHADIILTPVNGEGNTVTYSLGALDAGTHSHTIDLATLKGNFNWSVSVANKTNLSTEIVFTDNSWEAGANAKLNGGVAIDNNTESDNFGSVYVSTANKGIYVFDAAGEKKSETPYWTSHTGTLARGTVSNGKFYVADNSATGGIYMLNPANPEDINTVATGNACCAVAFKGEGETRDMYAIGSHNGAYNLLSYKGINGADTWSGSGSYVEAADDKIFGNNHHSIIATESGLLISQYREKSSNYAPAFFFIDYNGTISQYGDNLASTLAACKKSAMALSKDASLFAIIDGTSNIQVYDVTWSGGVPTFTHKLAIPTNTGNIWQLAFDYAGNLHCYGEEAGYYIHAIPCDAHSISTPAKASLVIKGTSSSAIESIGIDDTNAPVEYYNLQGVKVANPSNGIFIKKQGAKATKVIL